MKLDAIEGLMGMGYSFEEAAVIRPFLSRHFSVWQALPEDGPTGKLVERFVERVLNRNRNEFSLRWADGKERKHLNPSPWCMLVFRCDGEEFTFPAIEFVRRYGLAIYTELGTNGAGRVLVYDRGELRIKTKQLAELYHERHVTALV
ncbi:hypothetical protein KW817_22350 [Enterobacter quasiroggenkampii]|uniref:hypothetical protein n=1 Tax=Enterobacter quasiroggenkampii TaxID=2497436 RepID=UPI0021CED8D7|nr:hypothetical protein [Enterobacter quasiroggenkampii]MCU6405718.1 hypothetical protein [Enterobacter quasiroggenkampii]